MKLTYNGRHVLVLPRADGGKAIVLSPGQSISLEDKDWHNLYARKDVKVMQRKGSLIASGALPETVVAVEPIELPLPEIEPSANPKEEELDFIERFINDGWKRAQFKAKSIESISLVEKLLSKETRPSVRKALEDRLIDLQIEAEEASTPQAPKED